MKPHLDGTPRLKKLGVMPTLAEVPKHPRKSFFINKLDPWAPIDRYRTHLTGWWQQSWWSFVRTWKYQGDSFIAARVYLNGGGEDHELRFFVHDPRTRWGYQPVYGASNDFCRVTPDLEEHFERVYSARTTENRDFYFRGSLGGRGLSQPMKEDVLHVISWCDERVAELWKDLESP